MQNNHLKAGKMDLEISANLGKASGARFSISINPAFNLSRYWMVASGSTSHKCSNQSALCTLLPIENAYVTLPNHIQVPIRPIGNVKIWSNLMPNDVLYVSQFKFNLLSISALIRNSSWWVKFLTNSCMVQDFTTSRMISRGKRKVDLYVIDSNPSVHNIVVNFHAQYE